MKHFLIQDPIACLEGTKFFDASSESESLQLGTVCRLSLSGWGKTHQQIQLFQEEDDHLLSARHEMLESLQVHNMSNHQGSNKALTPQLESPWL